MRYPASIAIHGQEVRIVVTLCTRNLKHPVYVARYVPPQDEQKQPVWFGYIDKDKKWQGRRPSTESRSGVTQEEAVARLARWLDVAYSAWFQYDKRK